MHKIFIVGLGGSGGKTLQFLMDQLKTDLRILGWTREDLPRCWEFVHVDVPAQPDGVGEGLPPSVPLQGGSYIPVTTPNDHYQTLDQGLAQTLGQEQINELGQLVGWRPDPTKVVAPITTGAGQYRAVGRLATLARSGRIYADLLSSANRLQSPEATNDLRSLTRLMQLSNSAAQGTMVMVVSSLAGGTGASMTLDICNLLRGVQNEVDRFPGDQAIAYLYTPDVFASLPASARSGVNANALGSIAEIMAATSSLNKPWTREEWRVYQAGSAPAKPGRGPKAVFPVGAVNGMTGATFGDGKPETIYRGFGRALASMFLSESQQTTFVSYVAGNFGNTIAIPDHSGLAWAPGGGQDPLGFGALGFASIGLGRDRYAEYAAQRLSRMAVDKLLRGHHDMSVIQQQRTPAEARDQYARDAYSPFLQLAALPDQPPELSGLKSWVDNIWPPQQQQMLIDHCMNGLAGAISGTGGNQAAVWFGNQLQASIPQYFQEVMRYSEEQTKASAQSWVRSVQSRIETAILWVIGRNGLPVAEAVLTRFEADLQSWAGLLRQNSAAATTGQQIAQETAMPFTAAGNGQINMQNELIVVALRNLRRQFASAASRRGAAVGADLLDSMATEVIRPLGRALADTRAGLVAADANTSAIRTVSGVRSSVVQSWPLENEVPGRFGGATNEVLLENINNYPLTFETHVYQTFAHVEVLNRRPDLADSLAISVEQVITFMDVDAARRRPPAPVEQLTAFLDDGSPVKLGRQASWWPRSLAGGVQTAQTSFYAVGLGADSLLAGARIWVSRFGLPFQAHISQGLKSYLSNDGQRPPVEQAAIESDFADKFFTALTLGAPLVDVNGAMVQAVHGQPVKVSYKFSAAPIGAARDAVEQITQAISSQSELSQDTVAELHEAINHQQANIDLPRIDIIGTYDRPYSPIVFSSLQKPIQNQWNQSTSEVEQTAFWKWRRGRSLEDFAPVSPTWQQAFITGWLVGRITGEVITPKPGEVNKTVRVWSGDQREWLEFPRRLLGVRALNEDVLSWDIPAAVLESLALAVAESNGDTLMRPLTPYVATRKLGEELPRAGHSRHEALEAWILSGSPRPWSAAGPGDIKVLPQVVRGDSPSAQADATPLVRLTQAQDWLTKLRHSITEKLLPDGVLGSTGRGEFSRIHQHNFWQVPRQWETARLLAVGCDQIQAEFLRPAYQSVDSGNYGIDDVDA